MSAEDDPALDLERRFEGVATWSYVHGLHERIEALETWRAAQDAITARRRWALPITLTAVGLGVNVLLYLLTHR